MTYYIKNIYPNALCIIVAVIIFYSKQLVLSNVKHNFELKYRVHSVRKNI